MANSLLDMARERGLQTPQRIEPVSEPITVSDFEQTGLEKALGSFVREGLRSVISTGSRFVTSTALRPFDPSGQTLTKMIPESVNIPGLGSIQLRQAEEPLRELGFLMEDAANLVTGGGAGTLARTTAKQVFKEGVRIGARTGLQAGGLTGAGQALQEEAGAGEVALRGATGATAGAVLGALIGGGTSVLGRTLLGSPVPETATVDDVVQLADDLISKKAAPTEQAAVSGELVSQLKRSTPEVSILEKWAGVRPDIKNRIQGKKDQLVTYFNIAEARNMSDTMATPLEFASKKVRGAEGVMTDLLSDTGSKIGAFRNKTETMLVPVDDVSRITKAFEDELAGINLRIQNGRVEQVPGKASISTAGDLNALQDLYNNIRIIKQSPNVANLLDTRISFDNKINFGRAAREVSGAVDSISRRIRSEIASVNRSVIGAEQSGLLAEYEQFMRALTDLRSFTDRRAGAEFLLKRVLSERGAEPRAIISTIKDYTGIDLMDDAVMSMLATDLIGNQSQKGLFRQEISKAGLDVVDLLSGGKAGILRTLVEKGAERLLPVRKIFERAAE